MTKSQVSMFLALLSLTGCAPAQSPQFDEDMSTIRSGYRECVNDLGPESPACKSLSDGVHQVAEQVGSAQSTAGAIKAESAARHSLGY